MFDYWSDYFGYSRRVITRDDLGHLGGDPHFRPPHYSAANDIAHGIAPGGKYSRGQDRELDNDR